MKARFKLDTLYKFILQFAERYHQAKSKLEEEARQSSIFIKYKISTTYDEYKKSGKLLIQSKRGGAYCYMTPQEICSDEALISHLHPIDVSIVTKLQLEAGRNTNTSSIVKQWFSTEKGETMYLIYDSLSDEHQEVCESELIDATHLITRLSVQDCMSIGFGMGVEHSKRIANIAK